VALTLRTSWADGTRQLVFEPLDLLEKLAALVPRPRINLVLYHGVLAPDSRWRGRVVAYGGLRATVAAASAGPAAIDESTPVVHHWRWAD
jgi:Putative transposase